MKQANAQTRNVLIVDDEKLFLKSIADGLKAYEKKYNFKMLAAQNGQEALDCFGANEIALLITDLRMPVMDGIALLAHVHNRYPKVPVIVMTAFGSPQIEKQVKKLGIVHYLEKPIGFDELRDHILHELSRKKTSRIEGVTLASFLQLVWMEKMTCTLSVKSNEKTGTLSILSGDLKNAQAESQTGLAAALEILDWENVAIELDENFSPDGETTPFSIEELLLESFRRKDERSVEPLIEYETLNSTDQINIFEKEDHMNVSKLNKSIEILKENLGGALLAADIFGTADMQSVTGFNSNPAACALFGQIITSTNRALKESGFPILGKYCLFDLVDAKMVVLIPMGDFIWGMLIDGKKAQLGLLLNIALPKAIAAFEDAITSN
ncbi:MAG: response regulator [Candidatus Aminicenantes bacterium]|nr:response regulator [Candidatus Aminicenantes bacterium]